jgi:hypothetical protein
MSELIENDPEKLTNYIRSIGRGLIVFDGRSGAGKTPLAEDIAKRMQMRGIDADPFVRENEDDIFVGALNLNELRARINASLASSPLVLLSTIMGRQVVEQLSIPAAAFVWVESIDDYRDPPEVVVMVGVKVPPLRAAVQGYMRTYNARDRADILYVNAFDQA